MKLGGKWIDGLRPEGSVADAARLSLSARMAAVGHWLPLAASQAEQDDEYVHQLRVSTRRAVAALALYRSWLSTRKRRSITKRLKQIRRAAGAARDLDVLIARLRQEWHFADGRDVVAQIAARRAGAQPAIVKIASKMRRKERLSRKTHALLESIRPRDVYGGEPGDFRTWAQARLAELAAEFFNAMPDQFDDPATLHPFRIRAKALRYAIELLAPAFDSELRTVHYATVEELQERLGNVNDHLVASRRFRQWSIDAATEDQNRALEELASRETASLADQIAEFREWWTADRVDSLRRGLHA